MEETEYPQPGGEEEIACVGSLHMRMGSLKGLDGICHLKKKRTKCVFFKKKNSS